MTGVCVLFRFDQPRIDRTVGGPKSRDDAGKEGGEAREFKAPIGQGFFDEKNSWRRGVLSIEVENSC